MTYSDEQIDAIKKYYPTSDYDNLMSFFPGSTKRDIKKIAMRYGVKSLNPGHRIDLTGNKFGRLRVISIDHVNDKHVVFWKCICECGKESVIRSSCLRSGRTKSCGCLKKDIEATRNVDKHIGEKFGLLTAIERLPNYQGRGRTYYRCLCECGNEKIVVGSGLVTGHTKTCGCLSKKRREFKQAFPEKRDNTEKCFQIYKHTAPNGKVYIGITRQNVEKRWQNGKGYQTQKRFWKAIQKYGWDNISHDILQSDLTEEAFKLEIQYIEQYGSMDPKFGYNTFEGGTTGKSLVNPVMQYYKGKPVNFFESRQQAKEKLCISYIAIRKLISGKIVLEGYSFYEMPEIRRYDISQNMYDIESPEHYNIRDLIDEQLRKKTVTRNKSRVRRVNQYDIKGRYIKTFSSIAEAKKECPGSGSITNALSVKGKCKTAGGFQWRYYDGSTDDIEPFIANGRQVLQIDPKTYELKAEFDSMVEAERETGIDHKQIFKACKREHVTSGGYIWRYADDPDAFKPVHAKKPTYKTIPVCKYSLEGKFLKRYLSIAEAERDNPTVVGIGAAVNPKTVNKSAGGYLWIKDMGDYGDIAPYHANGRRVQQINMDDGSVVKVYNSIREAISQTGIVNIYAVCVGKRKSAGGFFWRYSSEE